MNHRSSATSICRSGRRRSDDRRRKQPRRRGRAWPIRLTRSARGGRSCASIRSIGRKPAGRPTGSAARPGAEIWDAPKVVKEAAWTAGRSRRRATVRLWRRIKTPQLSGTAAWPSYTETMMPPHSARWSVCAGRARPPTPEVRSSSTPSAKSPAAELDARLQRVERRRHGDGRHSARRRRWRSASVGSAAAPRRARAGVRRPQIGRRRVGDERDAKAAKSPSGPDSSKSRAPLAPPSPRQRRRRRPPRAGRPPP